MMKYSYTLFVVLILASNAICLAASEDRQENSQELDTLLAKLRNKPFTVPLKNINLQN